MLRLSDKSGFGFGLKESGSGRAQHLRPVDNSVNWKAAFCKSSFDSLLSRGLLFPRHMKAVLSPALP